MPTEDEILSVSVTIRDGISAIMWDFLTEHLHVEDIGPYWQEIMETFPKHGAIAKRLKEVLDATEIS